MKQMRVYIILLIISLPCLLFSFMEDDLALYFNLNNGKRTGLTGAPYLAYSSDSGVGAGVQIVYFDACLDSIKIDPFEIQLDASFTSEGERKLELDYTKELTLKKWSILAHLEYKKKPSDFWGIGSDTPEERQESYTQSQLITKIQLKKVFSPDFSAGPILQYFRYQMQETEDSLLLASGMIRGSENRYSLAGAGFVCDWNHTDFKPYPRKGYRFIFDNVFYLSDKSYKYHFYSANFDLRVYRPVLKQHILCAQILSQNTSDNPPFQLLPGQGGSAMMRGYPNRRFLEKQFISAQIEYRSPFWMKMGLAAYTAVGNSYRKFSDFEVNNTHLSYGLGFRLNISKSNMLNMRGDIAFSKEGREIYFKVGEAF